jgi:VWFA-related protein
MFSKQFARYKVQLSKICTILVMAGIGLLALVSARGAQGMAQQTSGHQNPNQQPAPPEAGGPQGGELGPYAIPKKKEEPPPPPPEKPKKVEGMPDYSISVAVPLVNVDVSVVTKNGQFVPGLKKDNFKILEDGVPQTISNFNQQEAPITAVLLVEFASTNYWYLSDALNASYTFASGLKKEDWVAVVSYDMKPQILVDFTQDKRAILGALNTLRIPGFSERNLFDAVYDTLDRLDGIQGHKYIILISTGQDTFSKLNLDQIMKKIKATQGTTIYAISIGRTLREMADARGMVSPELSTDFLQADNQMNTFARLTGGRAYFPRFEGELPEIFHDIASDIRNEYNLAYRPSNAKLDGSYRKLKVELVGPDGSPLKIRDQKGKDVKYQVIAREGYTAKHQVE